MARERHMAERSSTRNVGNITRSISEPLVYKGMCSHPKAWPLDTERPATAQDSKRPAGSASPYTTLSPTCISSQPRRFSSRLRTLCQDARLDFDARLTSCNSAVASWGPNQYQPWHPRQWGGRGDRWGNNGQPPLDYRVGCTCNINQQEDPWTGHKACDQLSSIWGNLYWDDDSQNVSERKLWQ